MPAERDACELLRTISQQTTIVTDRRIYELAEKICDWDSLLGLAEAHRMLPQLSSRLAEAGAVVPPLVQKRLLFEYHRNVFHCTANALELIDVLEAFDHEMIPAIPYKGVVLAATIYPDFTMRFAGDLDLLIHHRHLARATAFLLERGYELKTPVQGDGTPAVPDYYEYHFERRTDGMVLELRWRMELRWRLKLLQRDLGWDWVWPQRRTARLAGAEVPDMNPEIKLLLLCMHGSKHAWSRLIWISDVARLLDAEPDLNWTVVVQEARRSGLSRMLALGILLAHRIAGAVVPSAILRRFESDPTACWLAQHIEENLFDAPFSRPKGRLPYNIRLLGFRDRFRLLFSSDSLHSNKGDRAIPSLSKSLYAVHYLIRRSLLLRDRPQR
jgi:Uncharacterised nucleotidyltransferase